MANLVFLFLLALLLNWLDCWKIIDLPNVLMAILVNYDVFRGSHAIYTLLLFLLLFFFLLFLLLIANFISLRYFFNVCCNSLSLLQFVFHFFSLCFKSFIQLIFLERVSSRRKDLIMVHSFVHSWFFLVSLL